MKPGSEIPHEYKPNTLKTMLAYQASVSEQIEHAMIETGGEIGPNEEPLFTQLELVKSNIPDKVDAIHSVRERLTRLAEEYKSKAQLFLQISKGLSKSEERLKDHVKFVMEMWDQPELIGNNFKYKLVNGTMSYVVDQEKLPQQFLKQVVTTTPDMEKVKAFFASGGQGLPGVTLVQNKSLRVSASKGAK